MDVGVRRDALRNRRLLVPGDTDGEGLGGAGQRLVDAFEKRCCLSPDRTCFVIERHGGARVEVVLGRLVGERRPDFAVDAVNLGQDDGGPHSHRVNGRGHHGQSLVSHERDGVVEGLSLPNSKQPWMTGGLEMQAPSKIDPAKTLGRRQV